MTNLAVLEPTERRSEESDSTDRRGRILRFTPLQLGLESEGRPKLGATMAASLVTHAGLIVALVTVPLMMFDVPLPDPAGVVRAFFVEPTAPPPPPPPPPPPRRSKAKQSRRSPKVVKPARQQAQAEPRFVAPIEVPEELPPEESFDFGEDFGVEGGVEGGVPGGVVGGVVGGLPEAPPLPKDPVRIGGAIKPPRLLKKVSPVYPQLAIKTYTQGIVIVEAHVGVDGRVVSAKVLRGIPLLDGAALDAVRQWRYAPLLLNGIPTEFLLTAVVSFELEPGER